MILIALGANLPAADGTPPRESLERALAAMPGLGIAVLSRSRWYRSSPVPASDQPDFVNGAVAVATVLPPRALLDRLHALERGAGRRRTVPNAARTLDLDLIDYDGRVSGPADGVVLPHPRAHLRAFVLRPIADIAPDWRHPVSRRGVADLLDGLAHAPDGGGDLSVMAP